MKKQENNYAFIDSQNLNLGIRGLGWELDFVRFRIYLRDKYGVSKAFLFLGWVKTNVRLYDKLQKAGFACVFKPSIKNSKGMIKGNCDAELVLWAMIEYTNYDKAVIVTGDGDFYCLLSYLCTRGKLKAIVIPNRKKFSRLMKSKSFYPFLHYLNDLERKLGVKKEKAP